MKRGALFFFAALAAFVLTLHSAVAAETVVNKGVIDKDTVWSGDILIKGDVEVAENVTLIIMPGATVRFAKIERFGPDKLYNDKENHFARAEIFVKGKMLAQGSKENKITFTSAESSPNPGDWSSLNFSNSTGNIVEHCVIMYGDTAVHCHSSHVVITNNVFKHNGTAFGCKNLKENPVQTIMPIMYNLFAENGGALLIGGGASPAVFHNDITGNEFFGLYVKKGGCSDVRFNSISKNGKGVILFGAKNLFLRDNNIADNTDYNLSMLEGQEQDLAFPHNWWGAADEKKIREKVMDKGSDSELGAADLSNFYTSAVAGAGNI
jgi:hypothetical protein